MAHALIIGSNRGIGLEIVRVLRARGDDVVAVCRGSSEALSQTGAQVHSGVDVTQAKDLAGLAERLSGQRFQSIVFNAGILERTPLEGLDVEAVKRQFEVNAVAPLAFVGALKSSFDNPSKLALITSRMGSIADNTSGGSYGYRMSKAALNAAGRSLAHDLAGQGVAVGLLHPGWVRTEMTGHTGHTDPDEAARLLVARLDDLGPHNTGRFWHANGEELAW